MALDKFKDTLTKAKNRASEMLDNAAILDNYKVNKESLWSKARDIVVDKLLKRTTPHLTD